MEKITRDEVVLYLQTIGMTGYEDKIMNDRYYNAIKQQIQNYGSVYASLHGGESDSGETNCYNPNTYAKYCDDLSTHKANHAVSIIGWDDDYSKDNFLENHKPKSNGAWIVRNSWGEDYGDKGTCYVSYEDANISSHGMQGITKALDVLNYDNKY